MLGLSQFIFGRPEIMTQALQISDGGELQRVHARAFHHGWSAEEFCNLLSQQGVFGYAARIKTKPSIIAGFVLARLTLDEAEILTIAVDPDIRKHGIGRQLMEAVLRHLYSERALNVFLEVDEKNIAAQTLYQRLNFIKVGERPAYYQTENGRSNAYVLRREIKQSK